VSEGVDLEALAATLEASGRYRVLRKIERRDRPPAPAGATLRNGLFVDVETTGLDLDRDEVIEIALVPFIFGLDGVIHQISPAYQSFAEPSAPLSAEITRITGITDTMLAGQTIDLGIVEAMAPRPTWSPPTTRPSIVALLSGSAPCSRSSPGRAR
jgi:DNA polymerase-3 subunit epsilon